MRFECPNCDAILKVSKAPAPRARLRCPRCDTLFTPPRVARVAPVEEEEAPRRSAPARTAKRPDRAKSKRIRPLLLAGVVGGLLVLFVGVVLVVAQLQEPK